MQIRSLKKAVDRGCVSNVIASKGPSGYSVAFNTDTGFNVLTTQKGEKRFFASLETLKKNMEKVGILSFQLVG